MRDVGDDGTLGGNDRVFGREDGVDAERLHEPALLVLGPVARPCHGAGMADRARQFGFPAPDDAGHHGFAEIDSVFVVATRLGVEDGSLRAIIVFEGMGKITRRVVDVDVFARRDDRGRAPAFGSQILSDGRREATRVGQECDRPFDKRFIRMVAAKCAANSNAVPAVGHAQTVAAENVDAVGLAERTDFTRVVDCDLLGDDDDLLKFIVDAHQFGDAIAHARRRQVDDAGVEGQAGIEAFADVIEDGDIADRRRQDLPAAARRRAERDVAAREGVADRCDLFGFATQDVENAHAILALCDLVERIDAEIIGEPVNTIFLEHGYVSLSQALGFRPSLAAICARPPAIIQSSIFLA